MNWIPFNDFKETKVGTSNLNNIINSTALNGRYADGLFCSDDTAIYVKYPK